MKQIYPVYTTVEKQPKTICQAIDETAFIHPFFSDGVFNTKSHLGKKYDLRTIDMPKAADLLSLNGLIFNSSHCGSTLLCRMLHQIPEVKVISESEAINGLFLSQKINALPDNFIIEQLRKIIKLYQQRVGNKRYLVLKLTSWNVYFIDLILKALPNTKWIYLDRAIKALTHSLMTKGGGFIDWWYHPVDEIRKHFIAPQERITTKEDFLKTMIRGHRAHANRQKDANSLFMEYPAFIEQYPAILQHFGLPLTEQISRDIKDIVQYNAKVLEKQFWVGTPKNFTE